METGRKNQGILLAAGTNEVEFLLVGLGKQSYGINVSKICTIQVFDDSKVAPIPNQPRSVLGVMPFRDRTISIVDLASSIGWQGELNVDTRRLLVVTEFNRRMTGFVVHHVDRIERFNWSKFEPITETAGNGPQSAVIGTVRVAEGLVVILDLESIMSTIDPSMSVEHYAPHIHSAGHSRAGLRILHVDDSTMIQKVVAKTLTDAGFDSITQFGNGEEALNYLQQTGARSVDYIISDIEMPKLDGLSFCRALRKVEGFSDVPLVFFSSLITSQMASKCDAVGGNGAYSKPQINELVEEIDRFLAKK